MNGRNHEENWRPAKLSEQVSSGEGQRYLGELVAAVAHRPVPNSEIGHYVCYCRTDDNIWFLSNDSKRVVQTMHPFDSKVKGETVTMLVFKKF